ncbi:NYN domain-containing protein [Acidithiobacillus sp. AMEEHan]|uniref:NYN domain-containing protein n=1 Tax=Acidithiobacillus sp. AMEEHan TaxID=2994951 RepID=UPI0027E422CF|nr:NYN domain-containing protein [Acidithiobacillus sp. AMEEHan]
MTRVAAYIDGFNLYFGLKQARFKRYFWLDVAALARALLKPGQQLVATHYFSARICDNGRNAADQKRQNDYLEALAVQGVQSQFGHYLEKKRECRACHATWLDYEEKMTDVNIAIQLMTDAFDNAFDVALVISGDSDLTTPIRRVRERFPSKRVIVAFPPHRHSKALKQHASGHLAISENKLRASQLPEQVVKADGFVLQRPAHWK